MNRTNSADVRYGTPATGKSARSRSEAGRRCEFPGCETVLSTYNPAILCWMHTMPSRVNPLSRG